MLVKMRRDAVPDEVKAVETKLHALGFKTGKMVGEEITLIGVYGDISRLPVGEIQELAGVDRLIPISRAYKRAAQKGGPEGPIFQTV
jgi:3-deoxy-7-phosphoheptulonate synthase